MGLVVNLEHWPMPAAIALATEGVRANYNSGCGGGGFGAADREMACKIDGAKILSVIDAISHTDQHLADWCLFAYASPGWNSHKLTDRLIEHIAADWVFVHHEKTGEFIQKRTYSKIVAILPLIAGGLALEQASGACSDVCRGELVYNPAATKSAIIHELVHYDSELASDQSISFLKSRARYYQNHWDRIEQHIETIRSLLVCYDKAAQTKFKKLLENKMGAN
ncbi:hypothetical protein ACN1T7_001761 [Vibrio cholerae]